MISQAMTGKMRQKIPKTTDAAIIERDRFLAPKNSPRYAKTVLVAPEINNPLRSLKHANWKRFTAKLESTEAPKADKEAMIKIFLLP